MDDDKLVLEILVSALASAGYNTVTCEDGMQAIEKIRLENFIAVITDFNMPLKNGLEFSKELKSLKPEIPILVISGGNFGSSDTSDVLNALCNYSDEILGKPFDRDTLLATVENMVKNGSKTTYNLF